MKLSELKTGEVGVIAKVNGHGGFRKRLIEMGFISGKRVAVVILLNMKYLVTRFRCAAPKPD